MAAIADFPIPNNVHQVEIIPGNGRSPHTGFIVYKARYKLEKNKHGRGIEVVIKCGKKPKNEHLSISKEHSFLQCQGIYNNDFFVNTKGFTQIDGYDIMYMEPLRIGGRRSRWREQTLHWSKQRVKILVNNMFRIIKILADLGVEHGDIEFANIGSRSRNAHPVLFDFGRHKKHLDKDLKSIGPRYPKLKEYLHLDVVNGYNAWARELLGFGGVYAEEGSMSDLTVDDYYKLLNKAFNP